MLSEFRCLFDESCFCSDCERAGLRMETGMVCVEGIGVEDVVVLFKLVILVEGGANDHNAF